MAARVVIRAASVDDLSALVVVENTCFPVDKVPRRQLRYLLTRAKSHTLLATIKGEVVAYAMLLTPVLERPARLYSIAVLPQCRGMQLGRRLTERLLDEARARGYGAVRLEVRLSNAAARNIYEHFGFVPLRQLPGYYDDGEAALLMELKPL